MASKHRRGSSNPAPSDRAPSMNQMLDELSEIPQIKAFIAKKDFKGLQAFLEQFAMSVDPAEVLDDADLEDEWDEEDDLDEDDFEEDDFEEDGFYGYDDTPMGRALELLDRADGLSRKRQAAAAREALEICPQCCEAYTVLADLATSDEEALAFHRSAVEAAWNALGPDPRGALYRELEDEEPRDDYIEALGNLARFLFDSGNFAEANKRFRELLDLDSGDLDDAEHFDLLRLELLGCLLRADLRDELRDFLNGHKDLAADSPYFAYAAALLEFRAEGDTSHARKLLRAAKSTNRYVLDYLTGKLNPPHQPPFRSTRRSKEEAAEFAVAHLRDWTETEGAVSWIRQVFKLKVVERTDVDRPRLIDRWLKAAAGFPQTADEVWHVDAQRVPTLARADDDIAEDDVEGDEPPWTAIVARESDGALVKMDFIATRPADEDLFAFVLQAMAGDFDGNSSRPKAIAVCRRDYSKKWFARLASIGVELILREELSAIDAQIQILERSAGQVEKIGAAIADAESGNLPSPNSLPQDAQELWLADIRELAAWIERDGKLFRPWLSVVLDVTNHKILMQYVTANDQEHEKQLWHTLRAAMARPLWGDPRRPGGIKFGGAELAEYFNTRLAEFGVSAESSDDLAPIDHMVDELTKGMNGAELVGPLVDVEGVTNDHLRAFYAAALSFRKSKPWRRVPINGLFKVDRVDPEGPSWFGVVMGQSGMTYGLALYENLDELLRLMSGALIDDEEATRVPAISLTFGESHEMSVRDLQAIEKHGFPVEGTEGHPSVTRINRGGSLRAPLVGELELLTACLDTLSEFPYDRHAGDLARVSVGDREVTVRLEWL
jgi:tetratricopeptide (TPR) repeat protein